MSRNKSKRPPQRAAGMNVEAEVKKAVASILQQLMLKPVDLGNSDVRAGLMEALVQDSTRLTNDFQNIMRARERIAEIDKRVKRPPNGVIDIGIREAILEVDASLVEGRKALEAHLRLAKAFEQIEYEWTEAPTVAVQGAAESVTSGMPPLSTAEPPKTLDLGNWQPSNPAEAAAEAAAPAEDAA